jgi:hypothetical protein
MKAENLNLTHQNRMKRGAPRSLMAAKMWRNDGSGAKTTSILSNASNKQYASLHAGCGAQRGGGSQGDQRSGGVQGSEDLLNTCDLGLSAIWKMKNCDILT